MNNGNSMEKDVTLLYIESAIENRQLQLDLSNYQLTFLPPEIGKLSNLIELYISGNQLTSLPPEIGNLTNLTTLFIFGNQLTSLPPEIGNLSNLSVINVSDNKLTSLPPEIGNLSNLTALNLSGNYLTSLQPEIGNLSNLIALNLSRNYLASLPPEIRNLSNLTVLDLDDMTIPPPEIVKQGIHSIFEYLGQLPKDAIEHNEAKLILVGQGDVGKTCLVKRLIHNQFIKNKTTKGIDILEWKITAPTVQKEEIRLNVWDFGGQEIYHATHQFFLTKRSVYLLVWNARKAKDYENIYYWLHIIEAFGEDSPIILVMSKLNERNDDLNMKDIKEQFPQIIDLYKVDSEDGKGIHHLKEIIRQTSWNLPHMRTKWINSWFKVREHLEQCGQDWIDYEDFLQICTTKGLDNKQTDILDEYLHDLGVIIHFKDRLELRDIVILKPEWATKAVYKILDTQSVKNRKGILLHSELEQIWDINLYPRTIFPKLLELMNKFELAYELPNKKSHIVAELLPPTEPEFRWDNSNNLRFYYSYDFIPPGVMTRFIVRIHEDLENKSDGTNLFWREGAILYREDTRAFIKVKPNEKLIEIKIDGNKKREILTIIRYHFDHINSSIKKVKIKKEIPCNCSIGCIHRFDYEDLLKAENNGREKIDCPKSWNEISLSLLLDGYNKKENRMQELMEISNKNGFHLNINQNITQKNIQNQGVNFFDGQGISIDAITSHSVMLKESKKEKSVQEIIANPATIASFIITLAGILLQFFSNFKYAIILVLSGILLFILLVALELMKINKESH